MPQKKTKRKTRSESGAAATSGVHKQWILVALLVGLALGGTTGYLVGRQVSAQDRGLITDQYGRSPGHPHYRHTHP